VTWTILPKQLFCSSLKKQFFPKRPQNYLSTPVCAPQISPCHAAQIISEFLAKHSVSVSPHLPYSPDPAPCDFLLFPRLKITLKGKKFNTSLRCRGILHCIWSFCQRPTTLALEGGIITETAACSLNDRNLKEITPSYL
jgi:hypothetical protein